MYFGMLANIAVKCQHFLLGNGAQLYGQIKQKIIPYGVAACNPVKRGKAGQQPIKGEVCLLGDKYIGLVENNTSIAVHDAGNKGNKGAFAKVGTSFPAIQQSFFKGFFAFFPNTFSQMHSG